MNEERSITRRRMLKAAAVGASGTSGIAATDSKRCGDSQNDRRASPREVEVP